ncbi:MAG: S9 family peptidase [Paludibacteraceae bacterium]|nr:S9 family peptidase [Paludibacteraceae bacterium]
MKQKTFILALCAVATIGCMNQEKQTVIGRQYPKIENRLFSAEALWAMGRMGGVAVNAVTGDVAYQVSYYSVEENRSNTELFLLETDAAEPRQLTETPFGENSPAWLEDGRLAFLSTESGSSQVWAMDTKTGRRVQITDYKDDIEGFRFSPDGRQLLFIAQVKTVEQTADKYPDLPKASGRVVTDLMYKHWDEWTETAPHPFIADFNGQQITNIRDILAGEPYECPMKPFGGIEQLCFSPDCKTIAYTCRKKTGLDYAVSTNSDIYLYNIETGETQNLTEGMMGYDTNPQFSPDGTMLAWQSMERDGYESDWNRLFILDLATGEKRFITESFKSNVDEYEWIDNSRLVFAGCWHALEHLYLADLSGKVCELTDGQYDYSVAGVFGTKIYTLRHSMREANELYMFDLNDIVLADAKLDIYRSESELEKKGILRQLTHENKHIYDQVDMGTVQQRWQTTTDGKRMLTWIIYPPQFDPQKKYPTLLYCEGGPQSPVSQFWSYRWNFMRMAAHGYIIVAPNRRGLPGFGLEWNEQISGDYGGQCMRDYLTAIDEFCTEPYVDRDHLGCVGASFGGFSVYWLAGHHNKRFKAFIAHDGIFNMEMQYLETEEKWFANWDMGGAYWEKDNKTAQRTFQNSPHLFVDKWDTPILCIHGEKDYRILANQGMAAFDAAKMRGVPAELLIFPDENHWVLKPQNGILWQREFINWLDKWLK